MTTADKISAYLLTGMHHSTPEGKAAIQAIIDESDDTRRLNWLEKQSTGWADHERYAEDGSPMFAMRCIELDYFAEETLRQAIDNAMKGTQ